MKITIVTGGCLTDTSLLIRYVNMADHIIGVDRGVEQLLKNNLNMDIAIGDFDSLEDRSLLESDNVKKVITLNPSKDVSDTHAAVEIALEQGADEIYILSGIGSRMDHTMSNISLLEMLNSKKVDAFIINSQNKIYYAKDHNEIGHDYDYISLIPLEDGVKVNTKGFKYEVKDLELSYSQSRFLSNELLDERGFLDVCGRALIIEAMD